MKHELYALKDTLVGFSQPFPMQNEAVAVRAFAATVRSDHPNDCNTNPEHKQLWFVGTFDDVTGEFENCVRYVADATQFLPVKRVKKEGKRVKAPEAVDGTR